MAEGDAQLNARVEGGAHLSIQLRNIGWVDGTVAWVQDNRFGIAFAREIDASLARAKPAQDGEHSPRFTRPSGIYTSAADPRGLRKI